MTTQYAINYVIQRMLPFLVTRKYAFNISQYLTRLTKIKLIRKMSKIKSVDVLFSILIFKWLTNTDKKNCQQKP